MGTVKNRVNPPKPKEEVKPKFFSTQNTAYKAGQAAMLSGSYNDEHKAYEAHENRGSNLHAQAAFKKKFLDGYNSVGISTTTTTENGRLSLSDLRYKNS